MSTPEPPESREPAESTVRYGRRRRAPRYGSFVVTGAIVGIALGIVGAIVQSVRYHDSSQFSGGTVLGYAAATLGLLGALLGGGVAVLFDRRATSASPDREPDDRSEVPPQVP